MFDKDVKLPKSKIDPKHIIQFLLVLPLGVFLAEIVSMFLILFYQGPYWASVLLDACLTTALVIPIIYFFSFRPLLTQISERKRAEQALQEQYTELLAETTVRKRAEVIMQARLRLMQYANAHTLDELLQTTIDEIEVLTDSQVGFFHFLKADQDTLLLQCWSTNTLQKMCTAQAKGSHYGVEQAGVWADCVRQRKPVIHNDYAALQNRKGLPEGHAAILRELTVPIMRDEKIVAILGVGNKPQDYTPIDVELVSTLSDFAWDVIEHKRDEIVLSESEQKFRTLADWTYDWEKWLDPDSNIMYSSPSCERITGYSPEEFIKDPDLLVRIVHPDDRQFYEDHQRLIHTGSADLVRIEYRILARDGEEHWIEHICRPLYGPDNQYLGRRVSNREITERKLAEKKIIEQKQKEVILTQTIHTLQTDIARDLHDTLGQNISFLRMNLEYLSKAQLNDLDYIQAQLQNMTDAANESYDLIRVMLTVLQNGNPADPLHLFTRYAKQVAERASFQINITSQGNPTELSPHQIRQLFYIFREALSNTEKYAKANQVSNEFLWNEHALTFVISDNGCGFNPDAVPTLDHYGLKFMRERAELLKGSFSVQSAPDKGTRITVTVPSEYKLSPSSQ